MCPADCTVTISSSPYSTSPYRQPVIVSSSSFCARACTISACWPTDYRRFQVLWGRHPARWVCGNLLARADVLDFPALGSTEPYKGDAAAVRVTDLAAVLVGSGSHLCRYPTGAELLGDLDRRGTCLLAVDGDKHGCRNWPGGPQHALGQQRGQQPGDPNREPDARVADPAIAGQRVVLATGGDRPPRLEADQLSLIDGAGVVVQTARDPEIGDESTRHVAGRGRHHLRQQIESLVELIMFDPQPAHLGDERGIGGADLGQLHAASGLGFGDLDL